MAAQLEAQAKRLRDAADTVEALTSSHGYVTDSAMQSSETVTRHPGPIASDGVASRLAKELGLSNLNELAEALKEPYPTVRAWNSRGSLPARIEPAVKKLRDARKSAKR